MNFQVDEILMKFIMKLGPVDHPLNEEQFLFPFRFPGPETSREDLLKSYLPVTPRSSGIG